MTKYNISKTQGFWYSVLAILFISPDSLLIRLSELPPDAGVFWRSLSAGLGLIIFFIITKRKIDLKNKVIWVLAISTAIAQSVFVYSLAHTSVANVLVLVAGLPPVFAVILSYFMMGEKTKPQTLIATAVCVFGVSILTGQGLNISDFKGIGFILVNSFLMAFMLTMVKKYNKIDILQAYLIASVLSLIGILFVSGGDIFTAPAPINYAYAILNGIIFQAGFYIFANLGGKVTPSPIFSLLFLLETIIGTIMAIIFLDEIPTIETFIGGLIILSALTAHSIWHLRKS